MQGLFNDEETDAARDDWRAENKAPEEPFVLSNFTPQSPDETIRQSGLAWSTGIAFFAAIASMLLLGWFIDWLLGSAPWGMVIGIVVGALIGFFQLFRTTSQIFKNNDSGPSQHPLMDSSRKIEPDGAKPSDADDSSF